MRFVALVFPLCCSDVYRHALRLPVRSYGCGYPLMLPTSGNLYAVLGRLRVCFIGAYLQGSSRLWTATNLMVRDMDVPAIQDARSTVADLRSSLTVCRSQDWRTGGGGPRWSALCTELVSCLRGAHGERSCGTTTWHAGRTRAVFPSSSDQGDGHTWSLVAVPGRRQVVRGNTEAPQYAQLTSAKRSAVNSP